MKMLENLNDHDSDDGWVKMSCIRQGTDTEILQSLFIIIAIQCLQTALSLSAFDLNNS